MPVLTDVLAGSLAQAVQVQQIIDALKGTPSKGVPVALTALNDASNYALTVRNNDATNSRALSVLKSDGTTLISADVTGVTLGSPLHIPVGSIGSNEITDGSVATVDLAANAVTQRVSAIFGAAISTSSAAFVLTGDQISITTATGSDLLAMMLFPIVMPAVSGAAVQLAMYVDATLYQTTVKTVQANEQGANWIGLGWCFVSPIASGAHLVKNAWSTTSGTLNQGPVSRVLVAVEFKR